MALEFDICRVGKGADCNTLFIEDKTIYGAVPADRASYALYLAGFLYNKDGEDTRLVIDNSDPENVVTWEVASPSDGYHYYDLLPVLKWTSSLSFLIGDVCYENTFYWKALTNNSNQIPTNTEGVSWEKVDDPYTEVDNINSSLNPVIAEIFRYDDPVFCRAEVCYGVVVVSAARNCCDDCAKSTSKDFMRVDVLLQAGFLLIAQTKFTEAHDIALLLADICNDLSDCGCS